jgi:hypothetical protein
VRVMTAKTAALSFECPHCGAAYKLVRVEADSQTIDRQITCRRCGAPFQGRQGNAVLKYFLVDRPRAQARRDRPLIPLSYRVVTDGIDNSWIAFRTCEP